MPQAEIAIVVRLDLGPEELADAERAVVSEGIATDLKGHIARWGDVDQISVEVSADDSEPSAAEERAPA